ncbi:hypothetical protein MSAN_00771600 [Mycena sanguinolenta]|uniref:Uncharacterized protein n=1 Tax=Mycena sanguinolenta TaxID=230812 RepID=A0A8H6Z2D4_9AGAR|nr:hypothetical protein MSAN_00771600 [Mycena sanguinolenta]
MRVVVHCQALHIQIPCTWTFILVLGRKRPLPLIAPSSLRKVTPILSTGVVRVPAALSVIIHVNPKLSSSNSHVSSFLSCHALGTTYYRSMLSIAPSPAMSTPSPSAATPPWAFHARAGIGGDQFRFRSNSFPPINNNFGGNRGGYSSEARTHHPNAEQTTKDTSRTTFPVIYSPPSGGHLCGTNDQIAFRCADVATLDRELASGGVLVSVHSVPDAVAWVEAHYDDPLLCAIRARNFDGPLAIPLSPEEPALAIFGSIADTLIPQLAKELARVSGLAVMVRPRGDSPMPNFATVADAAASGSDPGNVLVGKAARLRGGAGDELGSAAVPAWEGDYHNFTVDLGLKTNGDMPLYEVNLCSYVKFKTQSMKNSNPAILAPRPEVLSFVLLEIKLRRGETQLDRSFSNIGLLAQRANSISKCDFLDVGFEPPAVTLKRTSGQSTSASGGGTFGLAGLVPSFTATGGYTRGANEAVESADQKPIPRCNIRYDPGRGWDPEEAERAGKDFKSYDVSWFPETNRDKVAYEMRVEFGLGILIRRQKRFKPHLPQISSIVRHQIVIWVKDPALRSQGRGVMLLTSTYIPDALLDEPLASHSRTTVDLSRTTTPNIPTGVPVAVPDETGLSVSVAPLDKSRTKEPSRISKLFGRLSLKSSASGKMPLTPQLPMYETIARGWTPETLKWRDVLWPTLDRQFGLIDNNTNSARAAWKLEWNTNVDSTASETTPATSIPTVAIPVPPVAHLRQAALTPSITTDASATASIFDNDATVSTSATSNSGSTSKNMVPKA